MVTTSNRAYSHAWSIFWRPGRPSSLQRLLAGMYIPDPTVLHVPCSFGGGGVNESSM